MNTCPNVIQNKKDNKEYVYIIFNFLLIVKITEIILNSQILLIELLLFNIKYYLDLLH